MGLTASDISVLSREVHGLVLGGRIQRISDGRIGELVLDIRTVGLTRKLLLSAGDDHARLHLTTQAPNRPRAPSPFVSLLRKHISSGRVESVTALNGDRVVAISVLKQSSGSGEICSYRIIGELTGRHGNVFLISPEETIFGSLRANVSHRRKLVPGRPYILPTPFKGSAPPSPSTLPTTCDGAASALIAEQFEGRLTRALDERIRVQLTKALRIARKKLRRLLTKIERDWDRSNEAEQLRRMGELLQSAYGRVDKGASAVRVTDYYDPELGTVEIPLNPALDLSANIQRCFKDSKRFGNAKTQIGSRLRQTRNKLKAVEGAELELTSLVEQGASSTELSEFRIRLVNQELIVAPQPRPGLPKRGRPPRRLPYREFSSQSGQRILVGRGGEDNDRLTFQIARGRDLFLHVDGASGSHVIVQMQKGEDLGGETLVDAATLAAHYSSLRKEGLVDVRYTPCKYVRKPKGLKPGRVIVSDSKTISVRIDSLRLERLFKTMVEATK